MNSFFDPQADTTVHAPDGKVFAYGPRITRGGTSGEPEYTESPRPGETPDHWEVRWVDYYDNAGHYIDGWIADCAVEAHAKLLAEALTQ